MFDHPIIQSNSIIIYVRSKIVPENSSAILVPDRVYKENRANWNANYQQTDTMKHGNANWSVPVWQESPSRMWNELNQSNQIKNLRKVSAKQHYLSVARYVAGQSTNLPSRYRKFRNLIEKILIASMMLIFCYVLIRSYIRQNIFLGYSINSFEFMSFRKNHSQTEQSYDMIIDKSISILIDITRYLIAMLVRILFPLDIFLSISDCEFVGVIRQIAWVTFDTMRFSYSYQIFLVHFIKYFYQIKCFMIMKDFLIWMDQITRFLTLHVTHALRHVLTILF